jgi:hypothetical protein
VESLREPRAKAMSTIERIVKSEIIPQLTTLLPPAYSLSMSYIIDHTHIIDIPAALPSTPMEFHVSLALSTPPLYTAREEVVKKIQQDLAPKLKELSRQYGLDDIDVVDSACLDAVNIE